MSFTKPSGTPGGSGFNSLTPLPSMWLNYVSNNFPSIVDGIGGGKYELTGADLRFVTNSRRVKFNMADPSFPAELRGYVTIGATDESGYATGVGSLTVSVPATFSTSFEVTADLSANRIGPAFAAISLTGTNTTLSQAVGAFRLDATSIPLTTFRIGLSPPTSGTPEISVRGVAIPGSTIVYFVDDAIVGGGGVPVDYYEKWDGTVNTDPVMLRLQWDGSRWHVMMKQGAGLTGGAGAYAL